ncbi:hypothetical protein ACSBR1_029555 [Camellia fascicularis]
MVRNFKPNQPKNKSNLSSITTVFNPSMLSALTLQYFSINNLGDPFIESNYGVHSGQFEVGVLDWFAAYGNLRRTNIGVTLQIVEQKAIFMEGSVSRWHFVWLT